MQEHLAALQSEKLIDAWSDREILAGDDIDSEISEGLETCHLFLPLVSSAFLASGYIQEVEMSRALERRSAGDLRIIPLIIRPCDWKSTPLSKLMCLPRDGKAVSSWENRDEAYLDIVEGLRRVLKEEKQSQYRTPADGVMVPPSVGGAHRPDHGYRVEREFDAIDRREYREKAFSEIRAYFESSVQKIDGIDGIRARFFSKGTDSFGCTIVNGSRPHGTAHIRVYAGTSFSSGGDIWYSFSEDELGASANGILSIESDGFNLFLKPILMFSVLMGHDKEQLMSPVTAAKIIWKDLLEQAGVRVA